MDKYVLRNGNNKLFIMRKGENLSDDDFSYTESGNDITVTSYIGNNTDVKVVDKFRDMYVLVRPSKTYKVNIDGYIYEKDRNGVVKLLFYNGENTEVDTPILEGE